jgi:uncharacterized protein
MAINHKTMFKKYIIFFTFLLLTTVAFAQDLPPKSNTLVTDYTNTLQADQMSQLEQKLSAFNDSTTTQIAVVIIHSVGDNDINEYGQKLGRAWGIGQKGKNNGILVLVAIDDHKVGIATGYGAEGAVPDIITHQIIQNDITPFFKQKDYYGGLNAGTNDLMKYMSGEYKADKKAIQTQDDDGGPAGFIIIIIIVVVILIIIFRRRGGGGGGQIYGGRGGASPFWWFLGGAMLGRGSGGWGGFSDNNGGFGGGSSGSDSGGSFGDSGGFGGGDFGGGGSSGSW